MLEPQERLAVMHALAAIPSLLTELDITLSRSDSVTDTRLTGDRASRERALPYHVGASNSRDAMASAVQTYVDNVAALTRRPPPRTLGGQAAYLRALLPHIPDDAQELIGIHPRIPLAVADARRAIDRPVERVCVGTCPCGQKLHATTEDETAQCGACGNRFQVAELQSALLAEAKTMVGTAAELARFLPWFAGKPVTAAAIRQWAARGKLTGITMNGETVYRIGDVITLQRKTKR